VAKNSKTRPAASARMARKPRDSAPQRPRPTQPKKNQQ
jgi:hypothetical protein